MKRSIFVAGSPRAATLAKRVDGLDIGEVFFVVGETTGQTVTLSRKGVVSSAWINHRARFSGVRAFDGDLGDVAAAQNHSGR